MDDHAEWWRLVKNPPCNKGHIMTVTRVSVISSHQRLLCHQKKNQSLLSKMTERTGHFSKCNPVLHPCHYHLNANGCSFEWVHRGVINMALCTTAQLTEHNHQTAVIGGSIPALLFTLKNVCSHHCKALTIGITW